MSLPAARRQQGIAAITAMLVVALATVVAVELLWNSSLDVRRTQHLVERDQGRQIGLGLELLASELLRADFEDDPGVDGLTEAWAEEYGFPFEGGNVVGRLEDMQGRFNLNSLVDARGRKQPQAAEQFRRLIEAAVAGDRDLTVDSESLVDAVVDWLDPNTVPDGIGGAEDGVYTNRNPPHRAANFWFTSPTELLAVDNMTPPLYDRLAPLLTALPPQSTMLINVNTAPPLVLKSLAEDITDSDVQAWVDGRSEPFKSAEEFWAQVRGTTENRDAGTGDQDPPVATASQWFGLTVIVSIGSTQLAMYSLLERDSTTGTATARLRSFDTP